MCSSLGLRFAGKAHVMDEPISNSVMRAKRLIINADDFGWSRGISDGILLAHREGIITSTTLMVNQPASQYALELASQAPKLGVGIHLRLCDGFPVLAPSQVRSLVDQEGKFYSISETRRRLWRGRVSGEEIEAEFRAQIRWMKDRGRVPTHADSHHYIHLHPQVFGPFCRALRLEGIRRFRSPYQTCWPRDGRMWNGHGGSIGRRFSVAAYMRLLRFCSRDLASPDSWVDAAPQFRGNLDLLGEGWKRLVDNMPREPLN